MQTKTEVLTPESYNKENIPDGVSVPDNTIITIAQSRELDDLPAQLIEPLNGKKFRPWLNKHSYLCLPLTMGSQHGFIVNSLYDVEVMWDGGDSLDALKIVKYAEKPEHLNIQLVSSHFGTGILTIQNPWVFRTPPGVNLMCINPPNYYIDGIMHLTAVVETDNLRRDFTFNLKITRPNHIIRIPAGTPIGCVMPYPRHYIDKFHVVPAQHVIDYQTIEHEREAGRIFAFERENIDPEKPSAAGRRYLHGEDVFGNKFEDHQKKLKSYPAPTNVSGCPMSQNRSENPPAHNQDAGVPAVEPARNAAAELSSGRDSTATEGRLITVGGTASTVAGSVPTYRMNNDHANSSDDPARLAESGQAGAREVAVDLAPRSAGSVAADHILDRTDRHPARRYLHGVDAFCDSVKASGPSPQGVGIVQDFITGPERRMVLDFCRSQDARWRKTNDIWSDRIVQYDMISDQTLRAGLTDIRRRVLDTVRAAYGLDRPLFADSLSINRWRVGHDQAPHADSENTDGQPHPFPWRQFACIIYLNNDFGGGEIYFPQHGLKPPIIPGMLAFFPGTKGYLHGVTPITFGVRYTISLFLTHESAKDAFA